MKRYRTFSLFPSLSLSLLFLLTLTLPSLSAEIEPLLKEASEQLDAWRVPQAEKIVSRLVRENPKSPEVLDLDARVKFFQGRYDKALKLLERSLAIESTDKHRQGFRLFTQLTHDTIKQFKRYESAHFVLFLDDKKDGILVPHVLDTLEKSYQVLGEALGFYPQEKVRVEIAPDVSSFNAISTLSLRDIEETGAVGICKFNKIMTISPRTLMHGYRWLDSLSHEYLHYVIVGLTENKAPIWLHEGMARFYETRWRRPNPPEEKEDYLTPPNQTLLAQAIENEQFVGFKNMEPSLIELETPEEVQLAYAEAASAIDFMVERKGHTGIRELLSEVAKSSTQEAIETVMGISFDTFETEWKEFLNAKGITEVKGSRVRKLKVKRDQDEDEETVELKEIQSIVARNRTHLGDRLQQRGRMVAAIVEYKRALKVSPHSTIILQKLARAFIRMRKHEEALPHLKKAQTLNPDHVGTYVQLGRLYLARKNYSDAKIALEEAIQINPFNPKIYHFLRQIYTALGEQDQANKSGETLKRLMTSK